MQIVRYAPFKGMDAIEDQFKDIFGEVFDRGFWQMELPATDMYEEDGKLMVEVDLPKFKEDEVEITVSADALEIKAQHEEDTEKKERKYVMRESTSGSFWRRITLPDNAKTDEAAADFTDGVLKVSMPLTDRPEPKKLSIKSKK